MAGINLPSLDSILKDTNDGLLHENRSSRKIPIAKLKEFKDHPFHIRDDLEMDRLIESIQLNGVIEPILVRPTNQKGIYEIVSGHRRVHACLMAGIPEVEAVIKELTDAQATICMVDANLKREKLLPSELAKALRMKMNALKELPGNTGKQMAEEGSLSRASIYRYIKLTELMPELLDKVDKKRINVVAGGTLTDIDMECQHILNKYMDDNPKAKINPKKAAAIVALGQFEYDELEEVFNPKKEEINKIKSFPKVIVDLFPPGTTVEEMTKEIVRAVSHSGTHATGRECKIDENGEIINYGSQQFDYK